MCLSFQALLKLQCFFLKRCKKYSAFLLQHCKKSLVVCAEACPAIRDRTPVATSLSARVAAQRGFAGRGAVAPRPLIAPIVAQLRDGVEIERGYLGVSISPLTDDLADSLGIPQNSGEFIQSVQPGEAAEQAGIRAGDVVTKINYHLHIRHRAEHLRVGQLWQEAGCQNVKFYPKGQYNSDKSFSKYT